MHPSFSRSYILPAILLNPVLFLLSINTILSRVLPPVVVDDARQPPPYTALGPSPGHPHLDIHTSESLCWGYTILIVSAQLMAFGSVGWRREDGNPRARTMKKRVKIGISSTAKRVKGTNSTSIQTIGVSLRDIAEKEGFKTKERVYGKCSIRTNANRLAKLDDANDFETDLDLSFSDQCNEYPETSDSETML